MGSVGRGVFLPAIGRIVSMLIEWQRRAGGPGWGSLYLVRMTTARGEEGLCVGRAATGEREGGGPRGEEDALAFFVGFVFPPYLKKIIIICCLVVFIGFLLLGIDVVVLKGKHNVRERGQQRGGQM